MITGGPAPQPCPPRRHWKRTAAWIILALVLCAGPLAGILLHALPTFWGILALAVLLFLLGVIKLIALPARTASKPGEL